MPLGLATALVAKPNKVAQAFCLPWSQCGVPYPASSRQLLLSETLAQLTHDWLIVFSAGLGFGDSPFQSILYFTPEPLLQATTATDEPGSTISYVELTLRP